VGERSIFEAFLGMACFAALHGLHMVANSISSDKCISIIRISYLPTKVNSSIVTTTINSLH